MHIAPDKEEKGPKNDQVEDLQTVLCMNSFMFVFFGKERHMHVNLFVVVTDLILAVVSFF